MRINVVDGDLLEQDVDCIVNAWNRNLFPWWLLLPQGVSAAIKRRAGLAPFRELSKHGLLPLGGAVLTGAGHLSVKAIVHVAGIGLTWRASELSIRLSVRNALTIATEHSFGSIAFPLVGAGTGGIGAPAAERIMLDELRRCAASFDGHVRVVRFAGVSG